MRKDKKQPWILQLFNGYITARSNNLFRIHIQAGPFIFCIQNKQLYAATKTTRRNT